MLLLVLSDLLGLDLGLIVGFSLDNRLLLSKLALVAARLGGGAGLLLLRGLLGIGAVVVVGIGRGLHLAKRLLGLGVQGAGAGESQTSPLGQAVEVDLGSS